MKHNGRQGEQTIHRVKSRCNQEMPPYKCNKTAANYTLFNLLPSHKAAGQKGSHPVLTLAKDAHKTHV